MAARIGIDICGIFTDLVFLTPEGRVACAKVLSTPNDNSLGIAAGMKSAIATGGIRADDITEIIHGTTVATNAILKGKGAEWR